MAASIRRRGVRFGGLDVFVPAGHFLDAAHADRATAAVVAALGLAADLATNDGCGRSVSLRLPAETSQVLVDQLNAEAARVGVELADHAWPRRDGRCESVVFGLDPATVLLAGKSPAKAAATGPVGAARLSDASQDGRCPVGAGDLEVPAYAAALSIARVECIALDVRSLAAPAGAIDDAIKAWAQAGKLPGF